MDETLLLARDTHRAPLSCCAAACRYGDGGFTGTLTLNLQGSAGQSFACFLVAGMEVRLVGEANDYVGKGMAGGDVIIVPPPGKRTRA
jgi:glutamate synthase (ferredoxin)